MLTWLLAELAMFPAPWFVAGGWALDLYLDKASRQHQDVDVAIFRADQASLFDALPRCRFAKMVNGVLTPWHRGEWLDLPVHEIRASRDAVELEFLLNERNGDTWLYRRNEAVTLPISQLIGTSAGGVPYLAPEVVLLYKAKICRPSDNADFEHIGPLLSPSARAWLRSALALCHPEHPWRATLQSKHVA